jgi:hypothetical protein
MGCIECAGLVRQGCCQACFPFLAVSWVGRCLLEVAMHGTDARFDYCVYQLGGLEQGDWRNLGRHLPRWRRWRASTWRLWWSACRRWEESVCSELRPASGAPVCMPCLQRCPGCCRVAWEYLAELVRRQGQDFRNAKSCCGRRDHGVLARGSARRCLFHPWRLILGTLRWPLRGEELRHQGCECAS